MASFCTSRRNSPTDATYEQCMSLSRALESAQSPKSRAAYVTSLARSVGAFRVLFQEKHDALPHPVDAEITRDAILMSGFILSPKYCIREFLDPADPAGYVTPEACGQSMRVLYNDLGLKTFVSKVPGSGYDAPITDMFMQCVDLSDSAMQTMQRITYIPLQGLKIIGRFQ